MRDVIARVVVAALVCLAGCRTQLEDGTTFDENPDMLTTNAQDLGGCRLVVTSKDSVPDTGLMKAARSKAGSYMAVVAPMDSKIGDIRKRAYAPDGTPLVGSSYDIIQSLPYGITDVQDLIGTDNGFLTLSYDYGGGTWLTRFDVSGKTTAAHLSPKAASAGTSDGTEWVAGTSYAAGRISFWFDSVDQNAALKNAYKEFAVEALGANPVQIAKAGDFLALASYQLHSKDDVMFHLMLSIQDVTVETLNVTPITVEIARVPKADYGPLPRIIRLIPVDSSFILFWRDLSGQELLTLISNRGIVLWSAGPFPTATSDLQIMNGTVVSTTIQPTDNTIVISTQTPKFQTPSLSINAGGSVQSQVEIVMSGKNDGRFAITWSELHPPSEIPTGHIAFLTYADCD